MMRSLTKRSTDSGVTLVELVMTLALIAVLASIAFPAYRITVDTVQQKTNQVSASEVSDFATEWVSEGFTVVDGTGSRTGYVVAQDSNGQVLASIQGSLY
jgi:prepilin-type N-terminal cleavage/methylation domain-containing protein